MFSIAFAIWFPLISLLKFFIPNIREVHRRVTEYPQLEQTKNNFITWLEEEKQTTDNLKRNNAKLTKELKNEKIVKQRSDIKI